MSITLHTQYKIPAHLIGTHLTCMLPINIACVRVGTEKIMYGANIQVFFPGGR